MNKLIILLGFVILSCSSKIEQSASQQLEDFEKWKVERVAKLKAPEGYLNLAGLYWLTQGDNLFGSDSSNSILFPDDLPSVMGNFRLDGKTVTIKDAIEGVRIDSVGATEVIVYDREPSVVKLMEYETYRWYVIERAGDIGVRLQNLDHPKLKVNIDIKYFDHNPQQSVMADFLPYAVPKKLNITNVLGHEFEMNISGQLRFEIDGKEYTLEPIDEGDKFFIIFSDETSAIETYGSGRYMYADMPINGRMVELDFNKSYNPPCAFTDFATCLIPPPENRLDVRIDAGEYDYHLE